MYLCTHILLSISFDIERNIFKINFSYQSVALLELKLNVIKNHFFFFFIWTRRARFCIGVFSFRWSKFPVFDSLYAKLKIDDKITFNPIPIGGRRVSFFDSHKSEANDFKWLNNSFMAIINKIKLEWYQYLRYKIHNERSKSVGVLRV